MSRKFILTLWTSLGLILITAWTWALYVGPACKRIPTPIVAIHGKTCGANLPPK
ncbi:hypothetical protein [Dyella silvatica]|uniref:hypothetical protein n=1 Tax=Dyella silvatica TaxID=2992128 RepID=UPI002256EF96|nr:hypothetical protein [Dyella silvatica]